MIKLLSIIPILFFAVSLSAQVTTEGKPESFSPNTFKSASSIKTKTLRKLKVQKLLDIDEEENIKNRYSVYKKVNIDIKRKGTSIKTDKGQIWQYKIQSKNTLSIAIIFSDYILPEGATLFLYNSDKTIVRGAFTSINNKPNGKFALADFPGNEVILEYFEPFEVSFEGTIVIGDVGRAYRSLESNLLKSTGDENDINVTCEQGNAYQTEKHAVARMSFQIGENGYWCTGALINNTRNDGALFFLTANHCLSTNITANTLITYFNYEVEYCNGNLNSYQSISGSELIATNEASDFTLLKLAETPTPSYKTYFAGWDISNTQNYKSGFGIHHPGGRVKKIALEPDTIYSYPYSINWDNNVTTDPNTHWLVTFNEGATEGGSSGSPLFNEENKIIGQLHGGDDGEDYYGKLSTSWEGALDSWKLKPHLDPDNTGVESLEGYYPSALRPEAFLYSSIQKACVGEPTELFDGSAFNVDTWNWQFEPSTVQYVDGTNSASQFPVIIFEEEGNYNVSLTSVNDNGADNTIRYNYIVSGQNIEPKIKALDGTSVCYGSFTKLRFVATGADEYTWNVVRGFEYVNAGTDAISNEYSITKKEVGNLSSTVEVEIQLIGQQGTCIDTSYQIIQLEIPGNDNVEDAIGLMLGENGPFNNTCASAEENEPSPVVGSCNSQLSWCSCNNSDNLVDNSLWFSFIAPSSGIVGINAPGFDNQIALYEANTAADIISGNSSSYSIIAANDDYHSEDDNSSALILGATVVPNKRYWLQVDGSACGAFGEFNIELYPNDISELFPTAVNTIEKTSDFIIYPNPASDILNIKFTDSFTGGLFNLNSVDGRLLMEKPISPDSHISVKLPYNIADGIYVVRLINDKKIFTQQIVIQKE